MPKIEDFLMALYMSTGGKSWLKRHFWGSSKHYERWYGIEIDLSRLAINLDCNNLFGSLPLNNYPSNLTELCLNNNKLKGSIPKNLPQSLVRLELSHNSLTGKIPLTLPIRLKHFYASNNELTGEIPTLPRELKNMNISNNKIRGSFPEELPSGLEHLNIAGNNISVCYPLPSLDGLEFFKYSTSQGDEVLRRRDGTFAKMEELMCNAYCERRLNEFFQDVLRLPKYNSGYIISQDEITNWKKRRTFINKSHEELFTIVETEDCFKLSNNELTWEIPTLPRELRRGHLNTPGSEDEYSTDISYYSSEEEYISKKEIFCEYPPPK
eukprot:UN31655